MESRADFGSSQCDWATKSWAWHQAGRGRPLGVRKGVMTQVRGGSLTLHSTENTLIFHCPKTLVLRSPFLTFYFIL